MWREKGQEGVGPVGSLLGTGTDGCASGAEASGSWCAAPQLCGHCACLLLFRVPPVLAPGTCAQPAHVGGAGLEEAVVEAEVARALELRVGGGGVGGEASRAWEGRG